MSRQNPMSMNICDNSHEEVAYSVHRCPVCLALEEVAEAKSALDNYKQQNREARTEIDKLNMQLDDYEEDYKKWKEIVDKLAGRNYE